MSPEKKNPFENPSKTEPQQIRMVAAGNEILRFAPNGDIYVKGNLVKNDLEVVEGMRTFLIESGVIKPTKDGGNTNA